MNLSQTEAAAALQKIDAAGVKSRQLHAYRISSAILLLWGALWIIVGMVSYFSPENTALASFSTTAIGFPPSLWISYRSNRIAQEADPRAGRRWAVRGISVTAVIVTFILVSQLLLGPTSAAQASTYVAFAGGALCVGVGIFRGVRYVVVGGAMAVTALTIYWLQLSHGAALIWLAAGAAMVASGLWMRND